MKIGLDAAWLALKRIVDHVIMVSGDTDVVPALKLARKEGLKVVMAVAEGHKIHKELYEHSDEVRFIRYDSGTGGFVCENT